MMKKKKKRRTKAQMINEILRELEVKQCELAQKTIFQLKEQSKHGS